MSRSRRPRKRWKQPCSCWHCSPGDRRRANADARLQHEWRESMHEFATNDGNYVREPRMPALVEVPS